MPSLLLVGSISIATPGVRSLSGGAPVGQKLLVANLFSDWPVRDATALIRAAALLGGPLLFAALHRVRIGAPAFIFSLAPVHRLIRHTRIPRVSLTLH